MIDLIKILTYLIEESEDSHLKSKYSLHRLQDLDNYHQYEMLRMMLCERAPTCLIPSDINNEINKFIQWQNNNKIHTSITNLTNNYRVGDTQISLWRGDITTLADVTAIVNAANSVLLGCFQPCHKCIDNAIHTAAGPDLRQECFEMMKGEKEPVGSARITHGYNLPAKYVLHTVGPIISNGKVSLDQEIELASCYVSCLEKLEKVDDSKDKSIAFCCISTGLFAFPKCHASQIAVGTVRRYLTSHPDTTIKHVIFNVFLEKDELIYEKNLATFDTYLPTIKFTNPDPNPNLQEARQWLDDADYLIISAGAGLSASEGLDYMSKELFHREYSPFEKFGIKTLYGTIGFPWPTKLDFWNFFIYHYDNLYNKWPQTATYQKLLNIKDKFQDSFVITTNADGFFVKNGFNKNKVLTAQGNYYYIQCSKNCRIDAFRPIKELVGKFPLTSTEDIPTCHFCGSEMTMFLRMGASFNEMIVENERQRYREFVTNVVKSNKKCVILELGVGLNTPSILRWPNENKVDKFANNFKLIRVGLGPSATIPMEIMDNTIVIDADVKQAVDLLSK